MTPSAFLQRFHHLKPQYVLLFDLDGTLLDTNLANNEAYKYALWKVTGKSDYWQLSNLRRITRQDIAKLPEITSQMLEEIVQYKKNTFRYKKEYTFLYITHEILKRHSHYTRCYVISTADRERVLLLAQYYQLDRFVKDYIFADAENKYQDIASKLKVYPSKIVLFEDDKEAISNAVSNGINKEHVIPVFPDTLKKHIIQHNAFLADDIYAYYSLDYLRYGHPENPNFINTLKNQFNEYYPEQLNGALT